MYLRWAEAASALSGHGPLAVRVAFRQLVEAGRADRAYCTPSTVAELRRQLGDLLQHTALDLPHTITADGPDLLAALLRPFLEA